MLRGDVHVERIGARMNDSSQQTSANEVAGAGASAERRRAALSGDADEAFGARQADGLGLSGFYIETDDGRFVSALEHLIDRRAAEADTEE
jgi:hypothetical protein